ncbi:unnamed protein product [Coffea canephora]|uniref:phosphatidate phosphatase n=1 Tax=Coffea canephora TaxID=49390 RepID=A0A068UEQ9_COFCA|nr:unnamed protein product [Coffea canephora]
MNVVVKVGSLLTQGVYSVATPFHPFGGAVDIIAVQQQDGSFRSTPWYVRFGKFQGVLKGAEKVVRIEVNGIEANFHMYLDNSGEAYFVREVVSAEDDELNEFNNSEGAWAANYLSSFDVSTLKANSEDVCQTNNDDNISEPPLEGNEGYGSHLNQVEENHETEKQVLDLHYDSSLESTSASMKEEDVFGSCLEIPALAMQVGNSSSHDANSPLEVLEVAKDSQDKSPQRSLSITGSEDLQVPAETIERNTFDTDISGSASMVDDFIHTNGELENEVNVLSRPQASISEEEITISDNVETEKSAYCTDIENETGTSLELSLCRHLLQSGMGLNAAAQAFDAHRISEEEFKVSAASIIKNENLVVRIQGKYLPWDKAAPIVLGMVAYGLQLSIESSDAISLEQDDTRKSREDASGISSTPSGRGWRLWPNPFRRVRRIEHANSNSSNEDAVADSESGSQSQPVEATQTAPDGKESPQKQLMRTNVPTSDQIASLNLKEGQNMVTFTSFSRVLGPQKVEAHIYLWKWNARIVISDVDGTITKSDVLGQFMPLVGKDWTHSGIARLFSAIKENGYQLLFLSARAIVQAYITKSFLINLKQDGNTLPDGPVVISPDGLFPSLYREVIRRAPHEFKIACLEDIKALFPPDYNPFYAGFGNRDTDELSYRKIGIPKGKIFIINPKGEVAINHRIDVKSYTSLHTLVHDMFPPTSLLEQEDYNSWNYWKMPLPEIDGY